MKQMIHKKIINWNLEKKLNSKIRVNMMDSRFKTIRGLRDKKSDLVKEK